MTQFKPLKSNKLLPAPARGLRGSAAATSHNKSSVVWAEGGAADVSSTVAVTFYAHDNLQFSYAFVNICSDVEPSNVHC